MLIFSFCSPPFLCYPFCMRFTFAVFHRFGLGSDMAIRPRQPEPTGGESARRRDSQRLDGGSVWIGYGFDLSGFTGGRGQWSVSDYQPDSVKVSLEAVLVKATSCVWNRNWPDFSLLFFSCQELWGSRNTNQHEYQGKKKRCVLDLKLPVIPFLNFVRE